MKTMKSVTSGARRLRLERLAMDLSKRCPIDGSNPGSCPLCDLRLLGVRARRSWVHGLTLEDLQYLVLYHAGCSAEKKRTARPQKVRSTAVKA